MSGRTISSVLRNVAMLSATALLLGCEGNKSAAERQIAALEGQWSSSMNGDVMTIARDGSFRWGRPYSGRFSLTSAGQLVMSIRENGKWMGGMPVAVSRKTDTLRLTPPGGPLMEFRRIVALEGDSTAGDR